MKVKVILDGKIYEIEQSVSSFEDYKKLIDTANSISSKNDESGYQDIKNFRELFPKTIQPTIYFGSGITSKGNSLQAASLNKFAQFNTDKFYYFMENPNKMEFGNNNYIRNTILNELANNNLNIAGNQLISFIELTAYTNFSNALYASDLMISHEHLCANIVKNLMVNDKSLSLNNFRLICTGIPYQIQTIILQMKNIVNSENKENFTSDTKFTIDLFAEQIGYSIMNILTDVSKMTLEHYFANNYSSLNGVHNNISEMKLFIENALVRIIETSYSEATLPSIYNVLEELIFTNFTSFSEMLNLKSESENQ